jgi:hypothetical protein
MSVEYSKEQAEQVIIDQNEFCGLPRDLYGYDEKFLNHKFPTKIEYVGKVWKIDNRIFLCTFQNEGGDLHGYGVDDDGIWFFQEGMSHCGCSRYCLDQLTQATPTEWMEALEKFAESKYNVGDVVKCLSLNNPNEKIASFNNHLNKINCLNECWATVESGVALLMKDGIWADIITPAKDELNEKIEELTKLAESQGKNLKITFEN